MLEELLKEIQELKEYKKKYEYAEEAKQTMSDRLYDLMMAEYNRTTFEQRKRHYISDMCSCCRYCGSQTDDTEDNPGCGLELPQDIEMPMKSDKAWIPGTKCCKGFEWD